MDRYSNTLLVSLNNRISIRDASEARGVVIDCQVEAIPARACSEVTMNTIILEAVKPREDFMNQAVVEIEMDERVNSESLCLSYKRTVFLCLEHVPQL
jgi:hypothetical protein